MRPHVLVFAITLACSATIYAGDIRVSEVAQLREAIRDAKAGTTIVIASGIYPGGIMAKDLRGQPGRPIILRGDDPKNPPLFEGDSAGFHLSAASYLELRDLAFTGVKGNGINIDDGGNPQTPSHHITLSGLSLRDIGPDGNLDGLKLSGVDDFRVERCTIERWGSRGSGIDMVGCHRGEVVDSVFRHVDGKGDNGVQAKGGSREIAIRRCRFEEAGERAINAGGSTGADYFRPKNATSEASVITVEDCTFRGSMAAVAFVGIDGATIRRNTVYRPRRWAFRILQENTRDGLSPSQKGQIERNLIIFRSDEMVAPFNVGPGTLPDTFRLKANHWYCQDAPGRSRPKLTIRETDGVYGTVPILRDPDHGEFLPGPDAPKEQAGAREKVAYPKQ